MGGVSMYNLVTKVRKHHPGETVQRFTKAGELLLRHCANPIYIFVGPPNVIICN